MNSEHHGPNEAEKDNPWVTMHTTEVYRNPWIRVTHREVLNPSGKPGIYGVVQFQNIAIGILPLDRDWNTWLVGQYRYTLDAYSWEIPEGGCPVGADPLDAAKRELIEETGIHAAVWTPLLRTHLSNSVTDEFGLAYIAQDLSFGDAQPEETEVLALRKLPFDDAFNMVMDGLITDALSVCTILKAKNWINNNRISL